MKKWILILFRALPLLAKRVADVEWKIEKIALNARGNTLEQCLEIVYLIGYKSRLVNMKVMRDVIAGEIGEGRATELAAYAGGKSASELSKDGESAHVTYRRLMRSIDEATKALGRYGFDEDRMDRDYGAMRFLKVVAAAIDCKARTPRKPPVSANSGKLVKPIKSDKSDKLTKSDKSGEAKKAKADSAAKTRSAKAGDGKRRIVRPSTRERAVARKGTGETFLDETKVYA